MNKLSEKKQKLISAYYDRELGFFSNLYVQKVLLKNPVASSFLESLDSLSKQLSQLDSQSEFNPKWNTLNLRLLQVDKNSIYHEQDLPVSLVKPALWKKYSVSTTVATASVAFCLGLLFKLGYVNYFSTNSSARGTQEIATNFSTQQKATTVVSSNIPVTLASSGNRRSALELDWVKSDGRIRMIPAPNGSANIIWVKAPRKIYLEKIESSTLER